MKVEKIVSGGQTGADRGALQFALHHQQHQQQWQRHWQQRQHQPKADHDPRRQAPMPTLLRHGGWCPRHRRAEDGVIPAEFLMTETPSEEYEQRTELNVRDSDATVIFTMRKLKWNNERMIALNDRGESLQGGTLLTKQLANQQKKKCLCISKQEFDDRGSDGNTVTRNFWEFLVKQEVRVLNIAGPRESEEPGIGLFVENFLREAWSFYHG